MGNLTRSQVTSSGWSLGSFPYKLGTTVLGGQTGLSVKAEGAIPFHEQMPEPVAPPPWLWSPLLGGWVLPSSAVVSPPQRWAASMCDEERKWKGR